MFYIVCYVLGLITGVGFTAIVGAAVEHGRQEGHDAFTDYLKEMEGKDFNPHANGAPTFKK